MTEQLDFKTGDPVEDLRLFMLSKALELEPTNAPSPQDTNRHDEVLPHGVPDGDEYAPSYRIQAFREGSQGDGAIVQISFEDYGIDEGHVVLSDQGITYAEVASDGSGFAPTEVTQVMARQLLERLHGALD